MAEDSSPGHEPIAGISLDDITPTIYEGGFKTWECSIDLANYLAESRSDDQRGLLEYGLDVIEVRTSGYWKLF